MARPVCLFTGQWADLPLETLAAKAGRWGFDGLELACWGDHFEVELQAVGQVFTGAITAKLSSAGSVDLEPEGFLEGLVVRAKPAVVYLKGADKSGTGFFVTETGVIATNAHLARGEESLLAVLPAWTHRRIP